MGDGNYVPSLEAAEQLLLSNKVAHIVDLQFGTCKGGPMFLGLALP